MYGQGESCSMTVPPAGVGRVRMSNYWITVNGTDLSSWPTLADANRARMALDCVMNLGGRLVGVLAVEGPRPASNVRRVAGRNEDYSEVRSSWPAEGGPAKGVAE
jgi:hypothetical protein